MLINIQTLIDDAKCYEVVRQLRWPRAFGVRLATVLRSPNAGNIPIRLIANGRPVKRADGSLRTRDERVNRFNRSTLSAVSIRQRSILHCRSAADSRSVHTPTCPPRHAVEGPRTRSA